MAEEKLVRTCCFTFSIEAAIMLLLVLYKCEHQHDWFSVMPVVERLDLACFYKPPRCISYMAVQSAAFTATPNTYTNKLLWFDAYPLQDPQLRQLMLDITEATAELAQDLAQALGEGDEQAYDDEEEDEESGDEEPAGASNSGRGSSGQMKGAKQAVMKGKAPGSQQQQEQQEEAVDDGIDRKAVQQIAEQLGAFVQVRCTVQDSKHRHAPSAHEGRILLTGL